MIPGTHSSEQVNMSRKRQSLPVSLHATKVPRVDVEDSQRSKENVTPEYQGPFLFHSTPQQQHNQLYGAQAPFLFAFQQNGFFMPPTAFDLPSTQTDQNTTFDTNTHTTGSPCASENSDCLSHDDTTRSNESINAELVNGFNNVAAVPKPRSLMQGATQPLALPLVADMDEVFELVPARTALLAASIKHQVTIGEIIRRISPPECLHASLINGILRKAKAKDGGKQLRANLSKFGIQLPQGRRKTAPATAFTALCEEEAVIMARDFQMLCERDLCGTDIGRFLAGQVKPEMQAELRKRDQLEHVKEFLDEVSNVLQSAGMHPREYREREGAFGEATFAVQTFGLVTHGFGPNALVAAVSALRNIACETLNAMNGESNKNGTVPRIPMPHMGMGTTMYPPFVPPPAGFFGINCAHPGVAPPFFR